VRHRDDASGSNPSASAAPSAAPTSERLHADDRPSLADAALPAEGDACSIAIRARSFGGSTLSWYSRLWRSNSSHDGIDTTRERIPVTSFSWACSASATSLPLAISTTCGAAPSVSASTYAPRARPRPRRTVWRSKVGSAWRERKRNRP
jgi:hypothetical protein